MLVTLTEMKEKHRICFRPCPQQHNKQSVIELNYTYLTENKEEKSDDF